MHTSLVQVGAKPSQRYIEADPFQIPCAVTSPHEPSSHNHDSATRQGKPTLRYFDGRGLGEVARTMLVVAGVEYDEVKEAGEGEQGGQGKARENTG